MSDRTRPAVAPAADGVTIAVRVTPKAGRDAVRGLIRGGDGRERVRVVVTAAPADGKANAAVIALLAAAWRVPKSSLGITAGAAARDKIVKAAGPADRLAARLDEWLRGLDRED